MSTVLLTGATGHLGSAVLPRLLLAGHHVRTFSRSPGMHSGASPIPPEARAFTGDLTDGSGVLDAIQGVDAVVHCASDPRRSESDVAGR